MQLKRHIGFQTRLADPAIPSILARVWVDLNVDIQEAILGTLFMWFFTYKRTQFVTQLFLLGNDFPFRWLVSVDSEVPIDNNVYGSYRDDERNIEDLVEKVYATLMSSAEFSHVMRYSSQELKEFGVG